MKRSLQALVLLALSASPTVAEPSSASWSLFPETPVQSVQIHAPKLASATKPTEVSLLVSLPDGCGEARVVVEHQDDFTHVLWPESVPGSYPCRPVSRFDFKQVSLGILPPGEHRILVENVERPVEPVKLWVAADEAASVAE